MVMLYEREQAPSKTVYKIDVTTLRTMTSANNNMYYDYIQLGMSNDDYDKTMYLCL